MSVLDFSFFNDSLSGFNVIQTDGQVTEGVSSGKTHSIQRNKLAGSWVTNGFIRTSPQTGAADAVVYWLMRLETVAVGIDWMVLLKDDTSINFLNGIGVYYNGTSNRSLGFWDGNNTTNNMSVPDQTFHAVRAKIRNDGRVEVDFITPANLNITPDKFPEVDWINLGTSTIGTTFNAIGASIRISSTLFSASREVFAADYFYTDDGIIDLDGGMPLAAKWKKLNMSQGF